MRYVVSASLIIVGLIHLLPLPGVLGADKLSTLYGVSVNEPNLAILMRHRAVLFGLLGVALIAAAFKPAWQPAALAAGWVSVVAFLALAWSTGGYNPQLGRVVMADVVALLSLIVGTAAWMHAQPAGG
jgi:hypothetical protein